LLLLAALTFYLFITFFFTCTPTTYIYTLSLHDALPISCGNRCSLIRCECPSFQKRSTDQQGKRVGDAADSSNPRDHETTYFHSRSEEHTSELQSRFDLVCRLLLEKKKY